METVHVVRHIARVGTDTEDEKLIGIFKTKEDGDAAIARLKNKSGFKDPGGEWRNVEYKLNEMEWVEGYVGESK